MPISKRGILGQANPAADTDTIVYTVPTDREAIVQINAANRSSTDGRVRFGIVTAAGSIDWNVDALIHDGLCTRDTPVNFTGIALGVDEDVVVRADVATIAFSVNGLEFDIS